MKYNKETIKTLRLSNNMTPTQFAKKIGVDRQHVYGWEEGTIPGAVSLARIATAFGIKTMDIFFKTD